MLDLTEIEKSLEASSGEELHRQQIVTGFIHVHPGPLLDHLFSLTRPPKRRMRALTSNRAAVLEAAARVLAGATVKTSVIDRRRKLPADPSLV
jgi:hypothetical protein